MRETRHLTGEGVLRQAGNDVARVAYDFWELVQRDPATGVELPPEWRGQLRILDDGRWQGEGNDLVLHLQTHGLRLGVWLDGMHPLFTITARDSMGPDVTATP